MLTSIDAQSRTDRTIQLCAPAYCNISHHLSLTPYFGRGDAVFAYLNASWRGAISTAIALDNFPSSRRANDGMPSRSGIARLLCEACVRLHCPSRLRVLNHVDPRRLARALVPCAVLAVYTVDGDNTFDGHRLASVAQKTFLQGPDASAALKAPRSWSQLSGPPLLDGLY